MTELPTNATIDEVDGPSFSVKLQWVPRVGERIDLWSFIDKDNWHPVHHYEVVQVVHKVYAVVDKGGHQHKGQHYLAVHVKPVAPPPQVS